VEARARMTEGDSQYRKKTAVAALEGGVDRSWEMGNEGQKTARPLRVKTRKGSGVSDTQKVPPALAGTKESWRRSQLRKKKSRASKQGGPSCGEYGGSPLRPQKELRQLRRGKARAGNAYEGKRVEGSMRGKS